MWPDFMVSETVHQVLAHSHELIIANDGFGLGKFSETSLETNNKYMRLFYERLSRKNSLFAQLVDMLMRTWMKGDPIVRSKNRIHFCSRCNIYDHHTRGCPRKKNTQKKKKISIDQYFEEKDTIVFIIIIIIISMWRDYVLFSLLIFYILSLPTRTFFSQVSHLHQ